MNNLEPISETELTLLYLFLLAALILYMLYGHKKYKKVERLSPKCKGISAAKTCQYFTLARYGCAGCRFYDPK